MKPSSRLTLTDSVASTAFVSANLDVCSFDGALNKENTLELMTFIDFVSSATPAAQFKVIQFGSPLAAAFSFANWVATGSKLTSVPV